MPNIGPVELLILFVIVVVVVAAVWAYSRRR